MRVIADPGELSEAIRFAKRGGAVGFVPTMGNLHDGHLTLMRQARAHAKTVVCSIFVNPLQFGAREDLDTYPRTLTSDQAALTKEGVDLLFLPAVTDIYPGPMAAQTRVEVPGISDLYCGASRPGHFSGVTTVVAKLFNMVQPDIAVFGQKDFQQLAIIRQMVADLAMPLKILGVPTVRAADGVALSSRNHFLTAAERQAAPVLYQQLTRLSARLTASLDEMQSHLAEAEQALSNAGFRPDYLHLLDAETLLPAISTTQRRVLLAAAYLGKARLIDNIEFGAGDGGAT